jgi:uncharacterized protein (UPF0218 family)
LQKYLVPSNIRELLKNPIGELVKNEDLLKEEILKKIEDSSQIITVGDASTEKMISFGINPDIEVVDGFEMRRIRNLPESNFILEIKTKNPAGYITRDSIMAITNSLSLKKPLRVMVIGEEDLLVLPILAIFPIGVTVIYGQPLAGIVIVHLNIKTRQFALSLLREIGVEL